MARGKTCKDCAAEGVRTKRKAPYPGPRCATHNREVKRRRSEAAHSKHIGNVYGITSEEYAALYEAQGRRCAICGRADGSARRLAVDHSHSDLWVRGLLCSPCNKGVLGHLRDDVAALQRAIDYLQNPPAHAAIGKRVVPFDEEGS